MLIHPGGPRILHDAAAGLGLAEAALRHSWNSLRERGNLGGSAVLDVLARTHDDPPTSVTKACCWPSVRDSSPPHSEAPGHRATGTAPDDGGRQTFVRPDTSIEEKSPSLGRCEGASFAARLRSDVSEGGKSARVPPKPYPGARALPPAMRDVRSDLAGPSTFWWTVSGGGASG